MPNKVYTGKQGKITFDAVTKRFRRIRIRLNSNKFTADSSDTDVTERGTGTRDASIEIEFADSDDSGGGSFKSIGDIHLAGTAPSALSFTDTATTPASRLPTNFFTKYPLSGWRIDDVDTESAGPGDVAITRATLSPNNLD